MMSTLPLHPTCDPTCLCVCVQGFMMNNELLQRLTTGRAGSVHPLVIPRTTDTSAPLDYHSSTQEVEQWLSAKGFSPE